MVSAPQRGELPLLKITKESQNDTYSFYFDRKFFPHDFLPGQYLRVTQQNVIDERGNSRYFTIASSPTERDLIITTRIMKSAYKHALYGLKPGGFVSVAGPFGNFVLDENDTTPRVLIGGGIGITPFRSMSVYAYHKKLLIPITLFASFSVLEDVIYYDELTQLTDDGLYKVVYTITRQVESGNKWKGETGRLDKEKFLKYITQPFDSIYFIAGPQRMVEGLTNTIKEMGIEEKNIHVENFPGY